MRVVIDPGVYVAALITPEGPPAELVRKWRTGAFEVVASPHLLAELTGVMHRRKFRKWFSTREADEFIRGIARLAITITDTEPVRVFTRDPNDDYIVMLAITSGSDFIISGDRDLLEARIEIPVLTPRAAIEHVDR